MISEKYFLPFKLIVFCALCSFVVVYCVLLWNFDDFCICANVYK